MPVPNQRTHRDYSLFHQLVAMPSLAPSVSLDSSYGIQPGAPFVPNLENIPATQPGSATDSAATQRPSTAANGRVFTGQSTQAVTRASSPSLSIPSPTPLEAAGHLVSVTISYLDMPAKATSKTRPAVKNLTKSDHIDLVDIERKDFIVRALCIHNLHERYRVSEASGPPFKIYWKGSSGGKASAPAIDTDHDFDIHINVLLKKSAVRDVSVVFDTEEMKPFMNVKRGGPWNDEPDEELAFGTKVPRIDAFDPQTQLHGLLILQIKRRWPCNTHLGEHGGPGLCYVANDGAHVGLNHRRLTMWAAAIAAGDATKHEPPAIAEFDGVRDGRSAAAKPRGRKSDPATPQATDLSALLFASVMPLLNTLAQNSQTARPVAPQPATPQRPRTATALSSPAPSPSNELHAFLVDLLQHSDIDILECETALTNNDFTPDVIEELSLEEMVAVTGLTKGKVVKVQRYAREWLKRLEGKRRA